MKKIWKSYKSSFILLGSIILGGILGLIFKEKILILKPFGDLFLNLLLIVIVPLIFVTITLSIAKMKQPKRLSKILLSIVFVFLITSIISVLIGIISTRTPLINNIDSEKIVSSLDMTLKEEKVELELLPRIVNMISVKSFNLLFTNENMIALIVFSIMIGISINMIKQKKEKIIDGLDNLNLIIQNFIKLIMYFAPIGLGSYFATLTGTFGKEIALGYFKTFIIYTLATLFVYIFIYSLYAYIGGGKKGLITYWKNIINPTVTALATCSSAASMPVNIKSVKEMGVSDDIANTTVSLGTSFHKDGSSIGSVFKIMFLVYLFKTSPNLGTILIVSLVATLLVSAIPIGGGTISEMFIITMMGFPIAALPILTIIATIIDPGATVLNVVGDSASAMIISRIVDGKKWLKNKILNN